ncbi:MAG: carboxypeptidase regulatory-like domain-containing protein [Chloroflexota bacterium]|nr:carboxypeptidase regulatory-like domain-containing protein [Chloroflexota bacterium]
MGNKQKFVIGLTLVIAILCFPAVVYAHGAFIEYTSSVEIEIVATYDTGEPMSDAQVVVYAPDDPANPWLTGVCDEEGRFTFTPDSSKTGTWDVQVRKSGHGDTAHIPVGDGGGTTGETGGYTVLQIVLMSVCVIWGFIGTALYFSRRKA